MQNCKCALGRSIIPCTQVTWLFRRDEFLVGSLKEILNSRMARLLTQGGRVPVGRKTRPAMLFHRKKYSHSGQLEAELLFTLVHGDMLCVKLSLSASLLE